MCQKHRKLLKNRKANDPTPHAALKFTIHVLNHSIKALCAPWVKHIKYKHGEIYALDPPGLYPSPCTLPSSVHCPIHLHTGPAPSVYTAFLLMPCS